MLQEELRHHSHLSAGWGEHPSPASPQPGPKTSSAFSSLQSSIMHTTAIHSAIRHHVPLSRPESSSHPYHFLLNTVAHVVTSMSLPPLPPRTALNSPFISGSSRHMTATI